VKGVRFLDLVDAGDPVALAARYDAEGADELVFLDITASAHGRDTMVDVVTRTAAEVFIPFTVGGGVRAPDDARRLLRAGADKVALNTSAILEPGLIGRLADEFGSQCVVVAIDARRRDTEAGWEVFTHGGRRETGLDAVAWAGEWRKSVARKTAAATVTRAVRGVGPRNAALAAADIDTCVVASVGRVIEAPINGNVDRNAWNEGIFSSRRVR